MPREDQSALKNHQSENASSSLNEGKVRVIIYRLLQNGSVAISIATLNAYFTWKDRKTSGSLCVRFLQANYEGVVRASQDALLAQDMLQLLLSEHIELLHGLQGQDDACGCVLDCQDSGKGASPCIKMMQRLQKVI